MDESVEPSDLNHTELLLLAKNLNVDVCRKTPRSVLINLLECDVEHELGIDPLPANKHRLRIMDFIITNWDRVGAFVVCPAQSLDKFACYQCLDLQVSECWSLNKHIISDNEEA